MNFYNVITNKNAGVLQYKFYTDIHEDCVTVNNSKLRPANDVDIL